MTALPCSYFPNRSWRVRRRHAFVVVALICAAANAQTQCPGYVETDGGSAFDLATMIRDSGSPRLALDRVREAVSKIDAGGGCSIFANTRACEETLTLAHKAIVALQTCSSTTTPKGMSRG